MNASAVTAMNEAVKSALKWDRDASAFEILRFGRHREGYLHASVQLADKVPVYVHCAAGSWMIPREPQSEAITAQFGQRVMLQVLEPYSYLLADQARRFEDEERKMLLKREAAEAAKRLREIVEQLTTFPTEIGGGTMMTLNQAVALLNTVGYPREEKIAGLMEVYGLTEAEAVKALDSKEEAPTVVSV